MNNIENIQLEKKAYTIDRLNNDNILFNFAKIYNDN